MSIDINQMEGLTKREEQIIEAITNRYAWFELKQKETSGILANLIKRIVILETEVMILKNTKKGDGDGTIY